MPQTLFGRFLTFFLKNHALTNVNNRNEINKMEEVRQNHFSKF